MNNMIKDYVRVVYARKVYPKFSVLENASFAFISRTVKSKTDPVNFPSIMLYYGKTHYLAAKVDVD